MCGLVTPFFSAAAGAGLRGRVGLRPGRLRPLLPGAARTRDLSARLAVRGVVRLPRPRRGGDRPHRRGRRRGVRRSVRREHGQHAGSAAIGAGSRRRPIAAAAFEREVAARAGRRDGVGPGPPGRDRPLAAGHRLRGHRRRRPRGPRARGSSAGRGCGWRHSRASASRCRSAPSAAPLDGSLPSGGRPSRAARAPWRRWRCGSTSTPRRFARSGSGRSSSAVYGESAAGARRTSGSATRTRPGAATRSAMAISGQRHGRRRPRQQRRLLGARRADALRRARSPRRRTWRSSTGSPRSPARRRDPPGGAGDVGRGTRGRAPRLDRRGCRASGCE